jgi:hypothetical protein
MADAFDSDIFGPCMNDLHSPYVAGAVFGITVTTDSAQSTAGWTLTSSDQNVMRVTTELWDGSATVTAGNPGQATLTVLDAKGALVTSQEVSVALPDQVNLYAEGLVITGASDSVAQVTQASVVAGGDATFLVRYFAQGNELSGGGALHATANGGVTVTVNPASYAPARDFLGVTVPTEGTSATVSLVIDNVVVGELPITEVPPSAVKSVSILPQSTDGATNGTLLTVYAHAVDDSSRDVFGASFNWTINWESMQSAPVDGPVDLFFYNFDSAASETVMASYDQFSPSVSVHGHGGSVSSTADPITCALRGPVGGRSPGSLAGVGLAIVAAAFVRRRRDVVRSSVQLHGGGGVLLRKRNAIITSRTTTAPASTTQNTRTPGERGAVGGADPAPSGPRSSSSATAPARVGASRARS